MYKTRQYFDFLLYHNDGICIHTNHGPGHGCDHRIDKYNRSNRARRDLDFFSLDRIFDNYIFLPKRESQTNKVHS